jgi:ubiquitin conjugation factor E4 B
MDESLSELTQIHDIQTEMENQVVWKTKSLEYRREREGTLRSLESHAASYTTLGRSTVALLKDFTAETKSPFMVPEIVDRLAAMLDYQLDALAGPKYQNLRVKEPEKLKFSPRDLLSDILQIFLNLSDQEDFVKAVAADERSYREELFENAATIATSKNLKTDREMDQLRLFVSRVEVAKTAFRAEEDLGEVPDEFLGKSTPLPFLCSVLKAIHRPSDGDRNA